MRRAIVDTGPLVAFLDRAEQHHRWVVKQVEDLDPPLLVCEPVLAPCSPSSARASRAWRFTASMVNGAPFLLILQCHAGGERIREAAVPLVQYRRSFEPADLSIDPLARRRDRLTAIGRRHRRYR